MASNLTASLVLCEQISTAPEMFTVDIPQTSDKITVSCSFRYRVFIFLSSIGFDKFSVIFSLLSLSPPTISCHSRNTMVLISTHNCHFTYIFSWCFLAWMCVPKWLFYTEGRSGINNSGQTYEMPSAHTLTSFVMTSSKQEDSETDGNIPSRLMGASRLKAVKK